jgi:hypothetical protein
MPLPAGVNAAARAGRFAIVLAALALTRATSSAQLQPLDPLDDSGQPREMVRRLVIFFPPTPPPLDQPVTPISAVAPAPFAPPADLAPYVGECFYPQLGSCLALGQLNDKLRSRLDAYRAEKRALQNELRAELDRASAADATARRTALETLARKQAARLDALERTAERLRRDLEIENGDWSAWRLWHLGDGERRGDSPGEIAAVMRAYAYFDDSLSLAQRELLREIAMELSVAADTTANATAAQPFVFFSPAPARVTLRDDVPAPLAARIAAFQNRKAALKKQLYDAIFAEDRAMPIFRVLSLKTLAGKQAAPLAELEATAEEIRRGLAELPATTPPAARSPLPAALTRRIFDLVHARAALQREAGAAVDAIVGRSKNLPVRITYRFDPDALRFTVFPNYRAQNPPPAATAKKIDAIRAEISAIADDYGRRLADSVNERDAIRRDVAEAIRDNRPAAVEATLNTAVRLGLQAENAEGYRLYRLAVFEPGMSPEQRRLLFDAALEQLALPLPAGAYQPRDRASTW